MYQTNQLFLSLSVTESTRYLKAASRVIDAAVEKHIMAKTHRMERSFSWTKAYDNTGEWLPQETLDTIKEYLIAVKVL